MLKLPMMVVTAGMLLAVGGCGTSDTERAASGGLGGAAAGAVVGGPVGAVVGGAAGAGAGVAMDEGVETKVQEWTGDDSGRSAGRRTASAGGQPALSQQRIRNVQQALNDRGSDIAVDGIWGPNTRRALREFQQANGLEATGQLDGRTVSALNIGQTQQGSGGTGGDAGAPTGSGSPGNTGAGNGGAGNTGQGNTGQGNTGGPGSQ